MTAGDESNGSVGPVRKIERPRPDRRGGLREIRDLLAETREIVLTTHINADGDGAGSEAALQHFLSRHGRNVTIVNPTPFPESFRFLLEGAAAYCISESDGRAAVERSELLLVLDTSEPGRVGPLAAEAARRPVVVIDHHPPGPDPLGDPRVLDPSACATGELVYELLEAHDAELEPAEARGLYVAIVTDTGSFRFANSTPRAHEITAELLRHDVDPQAMYRRLFAHYTQDGLRLLRTALGSLRVDPDVPVAWISLTAADLRESGSDDTEGLVEYPRRLQGIEVAILFRELPDGRTKLSLRSNGEVNVGRLARDIGGGGHDKAAGALLRMPLQEAERLVLGRLRELMND